MNYEFVTLDFYGFRKYLIRNTDIISFRFHRLDGPAYEAIDIKLGNHNKYYIDGKQIKKEDYEK